MSKITREQMRAWVSGGERVREEFCEDCPEDMPCMETPDNCPYVAAILAAIDRADALERRWVELGAWLENHENSMAPTSLAFAKGRMAHETLTQMAALEIRHPEGGAKGAK